MLLSSRVMNGKTALCQNALWKYFSGTCWNLNKYTELTRDSEEEKLNTLSRVIPERSNQPRNLPSSIEEKGSDNVHKSSPPYPILRGFTAAHHHIMIL